MAPLTLKRDFRPLRHLPIMGVLILIITLIVMYSMFVSVFGFSRDLVLSRVLSLEILCQMDSLLATFVPNVGVLGFSVGFIIIELVFLFTYIKNRLVRPRVVLARFIIGSLGIFFLIWMLAFPTGRGNPFDLFHQVTAGLGVFLLLVEAILNASFPVTRKVSRFIIFLVVLLSLAAVLMLIVYVLESRGGDLGTLFAVSQFVYMGLWFIYLLTFSDSTIFGVKTKLRSQGKVNYYKLK